MTVHTRAFLLMVVATAACGRTQHDERTPAQQGGVAAASQPSKVSPVDPPVAGSIEFYSAAFLAHVADSLARGSTSAHVLRAHPTFRPTVVRRITTGEPEMHDHWIDVAIVQAGTGSILVGGRLDGARVEPGGEHRGGTIVGGATQPLATGDLFVVPAGVPHQFRIATGDSLRYLTIKVVQTPIVLNGGPR